MHLVRSSPLLRPLALATALFVASACDDDPSGTVPEFRVTCPASSIGVGDAIQLNFTQPITQTSAQAAGNVVLTDAVTGVEVPGSPTFDPTNPTLLTFRPSSQLAFGSRFRVRIQNVTNLGNIALPNVTLCDITTPSPLITELHWRRLPAAGGGSVRGVSLQSPTLGYVSTVNQPVFIRQNGGPFISRPAPVFFTNLFDVQFVDATRGFVTLDEPGEVRSSIGETTDGGVSYRLVYSITNSAILKLFFRNFGTGAATRTFGVGAGGPGLGPPRIYKYDAAATPQVVPIDLAGGTQLLDIDFSPDTALGAAVSAGTTTNRGRLFVTRDGGRTWTAVPGSEAPDSVLGYRGVGVTSGGSIVVTGFNGYVVRFDPSGTGFTAPIRLLAGTGGTSNPVPSNPVPGNRAAFVYTDVDFADDNPSVGWVVGTIQAGVINGQTIFRGLIFRTTDGGRTFTRQGVRNAGQAGSFEFGADFEALNRLHARSSSLVWAVGESGLVIEYDPSDTP